MKARSRRYRSAAIGLASAILPLTGAADNASPTSTCSPFGFTVKLTGVDGQLNGIVHKLNASGKLMLSGEVKTVGSDPTAHPKPARMLVSVWEKNGDGVRHRCSAGVDPSSSAAVSFGADCDVTSGGDFYIAADKGKGTRDGWHIQGTGKLCVVTK